ncbi:YbaK/EbsC family protein [Phreatobacter aquaticus]|uniref:YbaK/EbsC family protein n=1 Tax=Phreatobacter aquaticus TaxID=2570229 RepID=A0A4D7QKA5_9HYPH|nr:YbaK/EbsC family protein [Phreatobacter aquaticus]QCK86413.1 YbaK/EbsC family protein [Phreatobacter aquaticus]
MTDKPSTGSVDRVRAALVAAGHSDTITAFSDSTRTAADAAAAVGCTVAQIAKSIMLRAGETPVLVVTSGANRVNTAKIADLVGRPIKRADADWIRAVTGFAIGGVAPVGHITPPTVLIDEDLQALDPIWAAAGAPNSVFETNFAALVRVSGGRIADVKE